MKKSYFLVEIESEHGIDAETLQSNIYYRFPTSVESVKVEAVEQQRVPDFACTCTENDLVDLVMFCSHCGGKVPQSR